MQERRPRLALALGAGSARGLAHIGVLKVWEEERLPLDLLVGTSMGAIIGGLYASGISPRWLANLVGPLSKLNWRDLGLGGLGLYKGENFYQALKVLTGGRSFAQTRIPLAVVATDLDQGEPYIIQEGELALALRASAAVPVVFQPVNWQGRRLVDGALTARVPARMARQLGADLVIGVDVRFGLADNRAEKLWEVAIQSIEILERQVCQTLPQEADLLITPQLGHIGSWDFHCYEELIRLGEETARQALPGIRNLLARWASAASPDQGGARAGARGESGDQ
ncbi:MAG: patatin-like phospholipase family protein [Bacillota bacterium]